MPTIDPRERLNDSRLSMMTILRAFESGIRTAGPGIIKAFDPVKMTATVQPATQAIVSAADGTAQPLTLPLLLDCPVQFQRGGNIGLTMPIAEGDECLVVFADRCIDGWWQSGGVQAPMTYRMHDLSDGFCIPGVSSVPNVIPSIETDRASLRLMDNSASVSLANDGTARLTSGSAEISVVNGTITFTVGGFTMTITSAGLAITGGTVTHDGHAIDKTHLHTAVKTGTDLSGAPQ